MITLCVYHIGEYYWNPWLESRRKQRGLNYINLERREFNPRATSSSLGENRAFNEVGS